MGANELEVGERCQMRDSHTNNLVCWNERAYQCFHCKTLICEEHMRQAWRDGSKEEYCVRCYESSQLAIGAKKS